MKRGPWLRPQASDGEARHGDFAGLDVSVNETSVCIVDDRGRIVREAKVASEPEALLPVLTNSGHHFKRIGLEAGPLSQWLFSALAEANLPVICVETRHMRAAFQAQINKTDRNDAPRHGADDAGGALSSGACEDVTQPETAHAADASQAAAVEGHRSRDDLRGTLRNFGLKVGIVGKQKFEARIQGAWSRPFPIWLR